MRLPVLILLDTSGSMSGVSLRRLQGAVGEFKRRLAEAELVRDRVEICIMGFNEHSYLICRWTKPEDINGTRLAAYGGTDLSQALDDAVAEIADWRHAEQESGPAVLLLVTDGYGGTLPESIRERLANESIELWFFGLPGYDRESASRIADKDRIYELSWSTGDTCEGIFNTAAESIIAAVRQSEIKDERAVCDVVNYDLDRKAC